MNRPQKRQPDDVPRAGEWEDLAWEFVCHTQNLLGDQAEKHKADPAWLDSVSASLAKYERLRALPTNAEAQPDLVGPEITDEREPKSTSALDYEGFGREFIEHCQREQFFWDAEASEEICEIALKHGLVKREPYDPEKHGEDIEADPGCEIWVWQDMKPMGRHSIVSAALGPQVEGHGETSQAQPPKSAGAEGQAPLSAEAIKFLQGERNAVGWHNDHTHRAKLLDEILAALGATPAQTPKEGIDQS